MKTYQVELTGLSPLLMHSDNIPWRDQLTEYRRVNKDGVKGDDRSPAWSWIGALYHDKKVVGIPSDNIMSCIRDGASAVMESGKRSYKAVSQTGILVNEIMWPIAVNGKAIPVAEILGLMKEPDFAEHVSLCQRLGFELFVKSAKIGASKHTRVRPRFDSWTASGTILVSSDKLTKGVLEQIFREAGTKCGIGDWRPSGKRPGPFGQFSTVLTEKK